MSEFAEVELVDETPRRRWPLPLTWVGMLTVGCVLYEITAQPALGAMVMCIKLGWDDFRTAFWLRRRDSSRRRGRACFWLYLANGAWKVSAIGLVVSLLFILITIVPRLGQRVGLPREVIEALMGVMAAVGVGLLVGVLAMLRALWTAYRGRVKLWLHSGIHHAWHADAWPPYRDRRGGRRNRIGWLVFPQFLLTVMVAVPLMPHGDAGVLFFLLGGGVGARLGQFVSHSLEARSAVECWGAFIGDEEEALEA